MIESEIDALVEALELSDVDADKLADSLGVIEAEADSLVPCDVESLADSVAETLVAAALPGVRTVLPSVANVLRFVAVISYATGVRSDMI